MNWEVASKQFVLFSLFITLSVSTLFYYLPLYSKTTYNILQYIQDIFKTSLLMNFGGIRYIENLFVCHTNSYPKSASNRIYNIIECSILKDK